MVTMTPIRYSAFRTALPFKVEEVFVIHRESGLLLHHETRDPASMSDSDLISGMLTAIRDFAQDAFGQDIVDLTMMLWDLAGSEEFNGSGQHRHRSGSGHCGGRRC